MTSQDNLIRHNLSRHICWVRIKKTWNQ